MCVCVSFLAHLVVRSTFLLRGSVDYISGVFIWGKCLWEINKIKREIIFYLAFECWLWWTEGAEGVCTPNLAHHSHMWPLTSYSHKSGMEHAGGGGVRWTGLGRGHVFSGPLCRYAQLFTLVKSDHIGYLFQGLYCYRYWEQRSGGPDFWSDRGHLSF